jgi:hypothetical protein
MVLKRPEPLNRQCFPLGEPYLCSPSKHNRKTTEVFKALISLNVVIELVCGTCSLLKMGLCIPLYALGSFTSNEVILDNPGRVINHSEVQFTRLQAPRAS